MTHPADALEMPDCDHTGATLRYSEDQLRAERRKAWDAAMADVQAKLKDPAIVRAGLFRGEIAKPGLRAMLHLHGSCALDQWDVDQADAARWRYVATHWSSVQMRWNRDAANSFKGLTLTIAATAESDGDDIAREIDAAIATEAASRAALAAAQQKQENT